MVLQGLVGGPTPSTMRESLYGRQPVRETLRAGHRTVFRVLVAKGIKPKHTVREILDLANKRRIPVQRIERNVLDKIGGAVNHQGLAAEVSTFPYVDLQDILSVHPEPERSPFILLLDHIQDPQNLGSLLRSAEAAGVQGVVIPERRAAGISPAVVRASAGAAEHIPVAQVTNLVAAMEELKREGIWLAGLEAQPDAQLYSQANLRGPLGVVVGSEGKGMARLVQERCDFLIRLPMHGQIGSLNAAIAGAIALYEARRQRDQL